MTTMTVTPRRVKARTTGLRIKTDTPPTAIMTPTPPSIITFTADAAKLFAAVKTLSLLIPKGACPPGTDHIQLSGSRTGLRLTLRRPREIAALHLPGAWAGRPIVMNAKELLATLQRRRGGMTIRRDEDHAVVIFADGGAVNIKAFDTALEPMYPSIENPQAVLRVDAGTLADALRRSLPFTGKGEQRYALNNICLAIQAGPKAMEVAASDTHRLIRVVLPGDLMGRKDVNVILPGETVPGIYTLLTAQLGVVYGVGAEIVVTRKHIQVKMPGGAWFMVERASFPFPRYREVFPAVGVETPRVILDRKAMVTALKQLPVEDEENRVSLSPADGGRVLRLETNKATTTVYAYTAKMPDEALLNLDLLLSVLESVPDDYVTLFIPPGHTPLRMDAGATTVLLMPLWDDSRPAKKCSPADRGAKSLMAALSLPDPDPAEFFGQ